MSNTYTLTKVWQCLIIIPSVCLILLFWSPLFFEDDLSGLPTLAWVMLITVAAISGSFIYYAMTSKIIASPEGIESVSFGIRVKVAWDKVERIDVNPYGIVNLIFKESVYKNELVNIFLRSLGYDRMFQLSPYIEDLAISNLLKDLARYAPNSNIPEFVSQPRRSTAMYQKAGVIGLCYLGCFIVVFLFGIIVQKGLDKYLIFLGLFHANFFSNFIVASLIAGLFVNTMRLLGYNAEIAKLTENEISHKARAYYLCPIAIMVTSLLVSIVAWYLLKTPSESEVPIVFIIGVVSFPVSSSIEKLIYQDNSKSAQQYVLYWALYSIVSIRVSYFYIRFLYTRIAKTYAMSSMPTHHASAIQMSLPTG